MPLEVAPMAYRAVMDRLATMGCKKPLLRMAVAKAGPCVSDNGNFIIDADFGSIERPAELETKLCAIPGIIETGLFIQMASEAYFGMQDGYHLINYLLIFQICFRAQKARIIVLESDNKCI